MRVRDDDQGASGAAIAGAGVQVVQEEDGQFISITSEVAMAKFHEVNLDTVCEGSSKELFQRGLNHCIRRAEHAST